jgi:hypothetical protein
MRDRYQFAPAGVKVQGRRDVGGQSGGVFGVADIPRLIHDVEIASSCVLRIENINLGQVPCLF